MAELDVSFVTAESSPPRPKSPADLDLSFVEAQSPRAIQNDSSSIPRGIARGLGQGAFLGLGEEITGNIVGGVAKLTGDPRSFGTIRDEVIDAERAGFDKFSEENPKTALGATLAGGLLTGKPALGALSKAGVAAKGVRGVAASGAAIGGVAGAGVAEGGVEERVKGAAIGGALGAGIGLGVSGLGTGAASIWRKLAPGVQNRIGALAKESGLTPTQIASRLTALGPKATLADVTDVFRRTADVAASRLGPTARKVQALIRRDEGQGGRLMEPIYRSLGGTDANVKTVAALKQIRHDRSSPLYEKAFDAGVTMTERMKDLLQRPETQKAWRTAKSVGKSDPKVDMAKMGAGDPSFRGWQAITEHLWDRAASLKQTGKNKFAGTIKDLRNAILDELDNQSDDFRDARKIWAGTKQADDMLEAGGEFLKRSPAEVAEEWATMSDADKAFYRLGIGRSLEEKIATTNDTVDAARMFRNRAFREKAEIVFPDKESAVDFVNTVRAETIKKSTTNAVGRGSQTQPRQVVERQLGGKAIGAQDATKTGLVDRAVRAANIGGAREDTIQELGNLLLSQNPAEQQKAIRMMAGGQMNPLKEMMLNRVGAAGANIGGQR